MAHLVIQLDFPCALEPCALCGKRLLPSGKPRLSLADTLDAVCRECGQQHAPCLVSLLDLACTAERVGRIGRHTVTPPMTALLDLAHAAENYTHARQPVYRQSA